MRNTKPKSPRGEGQHRCVQASSPPADLRWSYAYCDLPRTPILLRAERFHARLRALPRRLRRRLQRDWRRTLPALAIVLALGQAPALAAWLVVAPGTPPGVSPDGACSLIEALENAEADQVLHADCPAGRGADTIVLPNNSVQSLTETHNYSHGAYNGLPSIRSAITIQGHGSTIQRGSAAAEFRFFAVEPTGKLTLKQVTLSGGSEMGGNGGALFNNGGDVELYQSVVSDNDPTASLGGGIYSIDGNVKLTETVVTRNQAYNGGGVASIRGSLTLLNSTVTKNSSGYFDSAGGIASTGNLQLINTTVSNNSAMYGGGLVVGGTATLVNSTVTANHSKGICGGIDTSANMTLLHSTVSANRSEFGGGGICNQKAGVLDLIDSTVSLNLAAGADTPYGGGIENFGKLTVTGSTLSGNKVHGYIYSEGGGLFNRGAASVAVLEYSTVTGNEAGHALYRNEGGGVYNQGSLTLIGTVVSGNVGADGAEVKNSSSGKVTVDAFNLFGQDGDAGITGFSVGRSDVIATQPLAAILAPLADNGGPTLTHALVQGSPAIDAGAIVDGCPAVDQRGVHRPLGSACDIGAVEYGPPLKCQGRVVRILGTMGRDTLFGTPASDVIHSLGGADIVHGLQGNDVVCGGSGNDQLFGERGSDVLIGGPGYDRCTGGPGWDKAIQCEDAREVP